jgi:predicted PhzF superfamily epimerase YddE/YHI9
MTIPLFQVDAFTNRPFAGNPAAVCLLERPAEADWMQSIAQEMNLSETAFLYPVADGFHLRWFTPAAEVALCGHATLASAHVLWSAGVLPAGTQARFHTLSGLLTAEQIPGAPHSGPEEAWIELDFPTKPVTPAEAPPDLLESLGVQPTFIGRSQFDYLLELPSPAYVRSVQPDFARLKKVPARGVIITAASPHPYDFISRFFAPAVGVDEDPVTGSAHTSLTPYWSAILGKTSLNAFQASSRGGELRLRLNHDRVGISGQAVTVFSGQLQA